MPLFSLIVLISIKLTVYYLELLCGVLHQLRIREDFAVGEGDLELGVLVVEVGLETVEVAGALPLAHGKVVEEVVAAGLGTGGRDLVLPEYPLQTLDGEATHVMDAVGARHNDIHAGEAAHRADIDDIVLDLGIAEPGSHQVLDAVDGCRCHCRFLIRFGDTEVERGETFVLAGHIDTRLQMGMVDCKTLYYFHI